MGTTGCHNKGIVSATAAQWQIVRHYDVIPHEQPTRQEARYRKEAAPYNPRCDASGACGFGCWGLQRCCLAPPMRQRSKNPPVSSKKPLPIQTCRCHLAPQHCGAQVQCQVNRLMCADFPSHRTLMKGGRYDCTVRFPPPTVLLGIPEKDQSCHHEVLDAPGTC